MPRWMILKKVLGVAASWGRLHLVAKSLWASTWMGWLAPYSNLRGHGFPLGVILSHHAIVGGGILVGIHNPQSWMLVEVLTTWVPVS
jgi:hypothetical protein